MKRLLLHSALLLSLAPFSPAAAKTDTLYFEFALQKGETSATIEYGFSNAVRSGIQMEYYDGQEHAITPTASGSITVTGNGYGRIYYTYGASTGYSAIFSPDNSGEDIRLSGVHLTSLDVHACTALTYLDCNNNQLTSLDVSSNTLLEFLDCSYNQLATLDVTANTALTVLHCYENQLTGLDVSQNTSLTSLWCYGNQLTALDVSANTGLRTLYCNNNQLTSLDVTALTNLDCGNNHLPLSTLYGIYAQGKHWVVFIAENQTDTVSLASCQALNLGAEKTLGGKETTYTLKNAANQIVSSEAYTQNNFSFQFNEPFTGTLTLQNTSVRNASMTYHITAAGCASEPPTPTTSHTDTLYFEFALETSSARIWYEFSDDVFPGIQMEYNDGQEHAITPTAAGSITVNGSGYGRIYYSYEESTGYSAVFSSPYSISDIRVTLSGVKLTSLDVHNCTALTSLYCSNNQLTSLDVSGCKSLTALSCDDNQLTTIDISTDTALEILSCGNNQLTSLNVHGCTALTILDCRSNQLTGLDVSHNLAMAQLWCYENQLTALDVSANTALKELNCTNNQLTSLNVSGCTSLEKLWCESNQLTALDVSANAALKVLLCSNNQLSALDVSVNIALTTLYCYGNQLTSLDVSGCTALKTLNCGNNHLPLSTLYGIYAQRADWSSFYAANQTDTVSLASCQALNLGTEKMLGGNPTTFELKDKDGNSVSLDAYTEDSIFFQFNEPFTGTLTLQNTSVRNASMTYHITAEGCATEPPTPTTSHTDTLYFEFALETSSALIWYEFSDDVFPGIEMEYYDGEEYAAKFKPTATESIIVNGNGYGRIYYTYEESTGYSAGFSPFYSTSDIDIRVTLSGVKLTSLDVHACAALTDLECYMNQLTSLNVSGCTKLTSLGCGNNQLTDLDVSHNPDLKNLYCGFNQLTSLDVSHNTLLEELSCFNNQLTALDVSANTELVYLSCSNNQLTGLDVSHNTLLEKLSCSNNQLTVLDVSANTALTYLDCYDNQLTALDVSGCTALEILYCYDNQLTALDVSTDTALTRLWCNGNQLTSLDVSENTKLRYLRCNKNQLTTLNISGCVKLDELYCQNNQLTTLDFGNNTDDWKELNCNNNHIPLSTLYNIYISREWEDEFSAENQSDTLAVAMCLPLDLSSEKEFDGTATTFVLKDEAGNDISTTGCTENDFKFQFHTPATYTLTLQNESVPDASMTYHITVEECLSVSVSSNNEAWGWATKTGNGAYAEGSSVTVIATPRTGYRFVNWTKDGEVYSTEAAHTFAVTENLTLVANFEEIPPVVVETFTVSVSANNEAWGSVSQSGNGTYEKDATVTLTATPNEGYRFVNWTKEGVIFGKKADTTFAVTENLTLVANFEEIPPVVEDDFTIILTPNNPAWGRVLKTGNCTYGQGEEITILALPFAGCRFVNWTKADGSVFATDSLYTFKVSESLELTANFEKIPDEPEVETFTVSVSANNDTWGSVSQSGEGTYEKDSSVIITATPAEGYRFVNWTKADGSVFSTDSLYTFKVSESLELTANFEKLPDAPEVETFTVSVSANNEAWGSVSQSGEGTYEKDSSVTITATPNEGYRFVNWTREGAIFGTASDTTFAVTEDLTLVANFEEVKDEKPTEDDIHIYVKDNTIYLPADKGKVEIFNVIGQCMYSGHATAVHVRQTGVYIVCIAGQNHKVLVM